jgi:uridine kinase
MFNVGRWKRIAGYFTLPFWIILAIKIVASFLFGSHYATQGFIPFLDYFTATLKNPYDFFFAQGLNVFSYPAGMLAIMSVPFFIFRTILPAAIYTSIHVQLFLLRIPVLIADVLIYVLLCYLLPFKEKKVLWLYFASPILFYINYFHGQLDVIPTALLLLSLVLLFRGEDTWSLFVLGVGMATKTHLIVALPFYCVYFYRNNASVRRIGRLIVLSLGTFVAINLAASSPGFFYAVFNNPEQQRLFYLVVPFMFDNLQFFVAPAMLLFVFYQFASYKKLNKDSLLLVIGLIYTVLVFLVPPMQGWFYWALPFLVFFFVKFRNSPLLSFWMMGAFYILYFIFIQDGDLFQSLAPTFPALAAIPAPFALLAAHGINAGLLENLLFTALETTLLVNILWAYGAGISSNKLYQKITKPFVVGIAGDSGVGKTKLAQAFERLIGPRNTVRLCGDDVHKWERGHENWNVVTHLNPKGNNVHLDLEQIAAFLRGESIRRPVYDHTSGTFGKPVLLEPKRFTIFEGLMPFVLDRMRPLFNFKIYIEADEVVRVDWKIKRDGEARGHDTEAIARQIESRRPDATAFIHPQKEFADLVIRYTRAGESALDGGLAMECSLRNSIFIEPVVEALTQAPGLRVEHTYADINFQKATFSGNIAREEVEKIAYELFPSASDLLEHDLQFDDGFTGICQLIFLSVVNNFYKSANDEE